MAGKFATKPQSLRAQQLPLGGAVAQRLRGYKWRSEKSVKAIAPTGAALAFLCFDFFFRIVKGEQPLSNGLRHPASASCLGRHLRLAGRCPNNCSLFLPLAAVAVVALRGGWSPEAGRGESEHPSLPLAQRSVPARLRQAETFPAERALFWFSFGVKREHPRPYFPTQKRSNTCSITASEAFSPVRSHRAASASSTQTDTASSPKPPAAASSAPATASRARSAAES